MSDYDGNIVFKEWLPDQPELNNPGLIEALNLIPGDAAFESFTPYGTTLASAVVGAPSGGFVGALLGAVETIYVHVASKLLLSTGGNFSTMSGATTIGSDLYTKFAQFDDLIFVAGESSKPVHATIGASGGTSYTTVALSGTAPDGALAVGVVNRFVVLGGAFTGVASPASVRWSAIDDPTNWPVPNSTTAIATQAGEQLLTSADGFVYDVFGGDQYGLIMQNRRITRMTYVGPPVVFQFDAIEKTIGSFFPRGAVQVGSWVYFISEQGFHRTNGVQVEDIGVGKVDRYFWRNVTALGNSFYQVCAAYDFLRGLVYWLWPANPSTPSVPDTMLIFNPKNGHWTRSNQGGFTIMTAQPGGTGGTRSPIRGFDTSFRMRMLDGTPGTAIITTGETEPNPGGFSCMQGIKPLVDVTANAITVAMGTRDNRTDAVSYTSEVTANSRSGFCDFRSEARYHRARLTIVGTFNAAQGLEYEAIPSGFA